MAKRKTRTINLVALEDQPLGGADHILKKGEVVLTGDLPEDIAPEKLALRVTQNRMGFRPAGFNASPESAGSTTAPNGFDFAGCDVAELKEIAKEFDVEVPGRGKNKIVAALVAAGVNPEYDPDPD